MDLDEFDARAEALVRESAEADAAYGLRLIEGRTATPDEIAGVERAMGVVFPEKFTAFMTRYGGGQFGFVDLFPVLAGPDGEVDDIRTVNDREFPDRSFVAVAPVGTGDHWGFPVTDGRCHDEVWFRYHDGDDDELVAADFLQFVADHGLTS